MPVCLLARSYIHAFSAFLFAFLVSFWPGLEGSGLCFLLRSSIFRLEIQTIIPNGCVWNSLIKLYVWLSFFILHALAWPIMKDCGINAYSHESFSGWCLGPCIFSAEIPAISTEIVSDYAWLVAWCVSSWFVFKLSTCQSEWPLKGSLYTSCRKYPHHGIYNLEQSCCTSSYWTCIATSPVILKYPGGAL